MSIFVAPVFGSKAMLFGLPVASEKYSCRMFSCDHNSSASSPDWTRISPRARWRDRAVRVVRSWAPDTATVRMFDWRVVRPPPALVRSTPKCVGSLRLP